MSSVISINGRTIGVGNPTYIIAEMSANHNQDYAKAIEIIHKAKESGADAVKIQTYTADTLTIDCDKKCFEVGVGSLWSGRRLYDLYKEAFTPWEWHEGLQHEARKVGLDFFSTPFDDTAVSFLEKMDIPAYKIASFELIDHALLKRVAETGKPVILSTGMASRDEIAEAVTVLRSAGCSNLALLRCVSSYPSVPKQMNLKTMAAFVSAYGVPVGLSDHSLGNVVAIVAVALGACIIEKHLTISRNEKSADAAFSMEPEEFSEMVKAIRIAESAIGSVDYSNSESEQKNILFRRSLFVVKDIKAGDRFTLDNIRSIRPGNGLAPKWYDEVLGQRCVVDVKRGTPLDWNYISKHRE